MDKNIYTLIIVIMNIVIIILTFIYFYIKNSYKPKEIKTEIEEKYLIIKNQKKEIKKLKRKLFFLKLGGKNV